MPRAVDTALIAYRASGRPMVQRHLIWVRASEIASGTPVAAGWWDGRDTATIPVIDPANGTSVLRAYQAAGSLVGFDPVAQTSGLEIHPAQVSLSRVSEAVTTALRAYKLRGAEVELHRLWLDYETRAPIAAAHVWFTGRVTRIGWPTAAEGSTARLTLTLVPATRDLTLGNPDVLSDAAQRSRSPGDAFLQFIGIAGTREIPWMRHRSTGTGSGAPVPVNPWLAGGGA